MAIVAQLICSEMRNHGNGKYPLRRYLFEMTDRTAEMKWAGRLESRLSTNRVDFLIGVV